MSKFYFDLKSGFVTADGALTGSGFEKDNAFALGYFCDGSEPLFAAIGKHPENAVSEKLGVCDMGERRYFLSFNPSPANYGEAEILFQTTCIAGNVSHLITCCRRGGIILVAETSEEIFEIPCPCALSDIKVSAVTLKKGHILRITACAGEKKLLAMLYYSGDYLPLITTFCDSFTFDGSDIICTEYLGGCNCCSRTRRLEYSKGAFCERELSFVYKRNHDYPDELIPYVFLEKLLFRDNAGAEDYLRRGLTVSAVKDILGDFDCIADFEFLPYRRFVAGVYKRAPYCKVRYFNFCVTDGLISDISPC